MAEDISKPHRRKQGFKGSRLRFLDLDQVGMIDEALFSLKGFGEVRLILHKGKLRFVVMQQSHDAMKWKPGKFVDSED